MHAALSSLLVKPLPPSRVPGHGPPGSPRLTGVPAPESLHVMIWTSSWWAGLVLAVAVLAVVLLRRRPLAAGALLLAGSLTAAVAPDYWSAATRAVVMDEPALLSVPVLLVGGAVSYIAATFPRRISMPAAVVALGVQVGGWVASPVGRVRLDVELFLGTSPVLAVALVTVIAWLVGHSIRQAHGHTQALRAQADAQAATAERLGIARDLHDQVAHAIGIIAIQAGMGRRVIDTQPAEARDALAAIEATSRETLAGLRQTVGALRQPASGQPGRLAAEDPGPLDPAPGLADLARLAATTLDAGVRVDVDWPGQHRPLPAEVDTSAYRIVQEAVTNVVRHAGTSRCWVTIDQRDEELTIEVIDHGRGDPVTGDPVTSDPVTASAVTASTVTASAVTGSGYGIAGMRERAALLHGELTAGPRPGGGFQVTARLPLPAVTGPLPTAARPLFAAAR